MLYTRTGDKGTSGLFGTKERFPKNSPIFEALGTVDELNSLLGICRSQVSKVKTEFDLKAEILKVQESLFIIQAELAGVKKSITESEINDLEETIALLESKIENPHAFVIPGASEFSALCDYARAVSRRAERMVIAVGDNLPVSAFTLIYLNRLSSFLYALARYAATTDSVTELSPSY